MLRDTGCQTINIKHIGKITMINWIKRIFLRKQNSNEYKISQQDLSTEKLAVLHAIEQNADAIKYQYGTSGTYTFYVFSINKTDPVLEICSVKETNPHSPTGVITYHFAERDTDNRLVSAREEKATDFAKMVYSKMFNTFVERKNGVLQKHAKQK